jgi:hypothetical protein
MMKKLIRFWMFLSIAVTAFTDENAYAQLSSLKTQIPPSAKPAALIMDRVDLIHNFELSPEKDKLIAKIGGTYFVVAAGQCGSINRINTGYNDLWFVKNGASVPNSNCRMSTNNPISISVLMTQFLIELKPGDTIATHFSASAPSLGFLFWQPDNEPAVTSFLFSIFKIDGT